MKRAIVILVLSVAAGGAGAGAGMFLKPPAAEPPSDSADGAAPAGGDGSAMAKGGDAAAQAGEDADAARKDEVARALEAADGAESANPDADAASRDFVRLEKQFVVPVLGEERVASLVVLSIALEVDEGGSNAVFETEPKLRDAFLGVLFTHAQSRGFDGGFTRKDRLADLRRSLTIAAQDVLGDIAHGVLLTNIVRQDI